MAENQPGDGKSNPFGNGQGSAGGGMGQGNNFLTNPAGQSGTGGGGQPSSFMQSRPQKSGGDPDINPAEIPAGGKDLEADASPDPGNPVGTGSVGDGSKPFKVS